jgi:hypothetical protein
MSKRWSTVFTVLLVLVGLAAVCQTSLIGILPGNSTALNQPSDDDDDDGPTVETALACDFFNQHKQLVCFAPKQEPDVYVADLGLAATALRPPQIFSRPFLIPTNTLLAQIGLPPRAPAVA